MIIEMLNRIVAIFTEYFDECSDTTIKDIIVIVFEVNFKFFGVNCMLATWACCSQYDEPKRKIA